MSRRKVDPIDDVFHRWMALDTDAQQRVSDMVKGYKAADGTYHEVQITSGPKPRKRKAPSAVTVEAEQ